MLRQKLKYYTVYVWYDDTGATCCALKKERVTGIQAVSLRHAAEMAIAVVMDKYSIPREEIFEVDSSLDTGQNPN